MLSREDIEKLTDEDQVVERIKEEMAKSPKEAVILQRMKWYIALYLRRNVHSYFFPGSPRRVCKRTGKVEYVDMKTPEEAKARAITTDSQDRYQYILWCWEEVEETEAKMLSFVEKIYDHLDETFKVIIYMLVEEKIYYDAVRPYLDIGLLVLAMVKIMDMRLVRYMLKKVPLEVSDYVSRLRSGEEAKVVKWSKIVSLMKSKESSVGCGRQESDTIVNMVKSNCPDESEEEADLEEM